jgi:serine/threonine protein kinase
MREQPPDPTDTGLAPPFRPPLADPPVADTPGARAAPLTLLTVGQCLGDFELLHELGAGSFARVFLARQISLERRVALKVSALVGSEARTLAGLHHDHIVQVYSETVDAERHWRLLCMQFVPGTTLAYLIRHLPRPGGSAWNGADLLAILDALEGDTVSLNPAALRERDYLRGCDLVQAVCWLGTRLAEALVYAHGRSVLHRDIKPANILVHRYGRPLLADFNLALDARPKVGRGLETTPQHGLEATPQHGLEATPQHGTTPQPGPFGGTLAYMAPEHLDAFNPEENVPASAVDQRSDIYALGVVLFELATGELPFGRPPTWGRGAVLLRALAQQRREAAPSPRRCCPAVSEVLDRVIRRCLDPHPERRYQTAAELGRALEGCRRLQRSVEQLPHAGRVTRVLERYPFAGGLALMLLPHVLATGQNIAYNQVQIVNYLTAAQQSLFPRLVLLYNAVVYAVCLGVLVRRLLPVLRAWRELARPEIPPAEDVAGGRRLALTWPRWVILLSCLGWLPGAVLFPLGLHLGADPLPPEVFVHFLISNALAGLIALTYAFFAVEYVVLRVLYPRFWVDAQDFRDQARQELGTQDRRLRWFQLFAGLIPLAGAALLIGVGPEQLTLTFRLLILGLLALGVGGLALALRVSGLLNQTLTALIGGERQRARPGASALGSWEGNEG